MERRNLWRGEIATFSRSLVRRIHRRMMAFGKKTERVGGPGRPCLRKHYAFLRRRQNTRAYHPRHPEFLSLSRFRAVESILSLIFWLLFFKSMNRYTSRLISISADRMFGVRRINVIARTVWSRCIIVLRIAALEIRHRDLSRTRSVECNELSERSFGRNIKQLEPPPSL